MYSVLMDWIPMKMPWNYSVKLIWLKTERVPEDTIKVRCHKSAKLPFPTGASNSKCFHHTTHQPPRITEHPIDIMVARHEPATLNCHAAGEPEPTISWFKDGLPLRTAPLDARSHRVLLPTGNLFFLRVVQGRKDSDAGVYWCEATNPLGKVRSNNATLIVAVLRDEFRLEPQSTRVSAGEPVLLECSPPRGTPEPVVTWRKDGHLLEMDRRFRLVDGASLAITDAKTADEGRYQCVARNSAGTRESAVALLKVHVKPYMIHPPKDIVALVGQTIEFSCAVGGDPLPDVLWRRTAAGGAMPLGRVRVLEDRSLRLERLTPQDQGRYTCEADNPAGALTASATLTVHASPTFTTRPVAQTVEAGEEVNFQCAAMGSPTPFVFWSFEGDRSLIFPGTQVGNFQAFVSPEGKSVLQLKNASIQNTGTVIVCSAINPAGSSAARTRLTVTSKEDRPPPVIIRGPANQTLPIKSVATLTCEATGTPEPVISWYKDEVPVLETERINITSWGSLYILDLDKADSGYYTCVASSRGGKATWGGALLVENPKNPNINFFKAPDPIMLPGPPSRPHALNQSEGSVTITWAQNNKIGSSSLLGYQIELFGREEGVIPTWTVVGRRVPGPTFTQHLLTPGIPYTFLIRTENGHGLSPPSQLSEPIFVGAETAQNWGHPEVTVLSEARATLISANIVKLTEVIPVQPTSVKLMWEIEDAQYVEGLYIYSVPLDGPPDMPKAYSMLTVLHSGGTSGFTVSNLDKYSRYEFFLVPFYKTVEGKPSNSRIVRTMEDVPGEAPSHMEALLLNSTAVYLKWRPPPLPSLNGELQGYKVEVRTNSSVDAVSAAFKNTMDVGTAPTLLLSNLTAGVAYSVRVAASTRAGLGPYSVPATLRLDPASRALDHQRTPVGADITAGDFITETWFMALLISMVTVMVLLFAAMLMVRRRQMLSKKSMPASRSNGGVLTTPIALKQEAPLWLDKQPLPEYGAPLADYAKLNAHEYSSIMPTVLQQSSPPQPHYVQSSQLQQQPHYVQKDSITRPDRLDYNRLNSSEKYYPSTKDFKSMSELAKKYEGNLNSEPQEYASPNLNPEMQIADYAEVDPNAAYSPAPYATTTLITGGRRLGSSLGWSQQNNSLRSPDESMYPASNGGYFNRNVYSDSYFAPSSHTLRRMKKSPGDHQQRGGGRNNHHHHQQQQQTQPPPDVVSPSQPMYTHLGPPGSSWRGGAPQLSSFAPSQQRVVVYHSSTKSEPGSNLL